MSHSSYKAANWTLLGLTLYLLSLPIISPAFEKALPGLWGVCPYKELTGRGCPLCGGTRAFGAAYRGDFAKAAEENVFAISAFGVLVFELIWRVTLLKVLKTRSLRVQYIDAVLHVPIIATTVLYYAFYFAAG